LLAAFYRFACCCNIGEARRIKINWSNITGTICADLSACIWIDFGCINWNHSTGSIDYNCTSSCISKRLSCSIENSARIDNSSGVYYSTLSIDDSALCIDRSTLCIDYSALCIDYSALCIDYSALCIDYSACSINCSALSINHSALCISKRFSFENFPRQSRRVAGDASSFSLSASLRCIYAYRFSCRSSL
jgi:hypothetical protein